MNERRSSPFSRTATLLVPCLLVMMDGCRPRPGARAPGAPAPGVSARCAGWETISDGPYRYENNIWGAGKAKGPYEQCLLTREVNDRTEYGWSWNFPGEDSSVFAYPEIIFGWKPWSGGTTTDPRFPLRVSDVRKLAIQYHVETEASGSYNLAPEIWLIRNKPALLHANPSLISAEIMFWMDYAGVAQPAGRVVATPTIENTTYELWKDDNMGAGPGGGGWVLFSFKSPTIRRQGRIDVAAKLEYLVESRQIDPSEYVACIEFGNEIVGGQGTTWVRDFSIEADS